MTQDEKLAIQEKKLEMVGKTVDRLLDRLFEEQEKQKSWEEEMEPMREYVKELRE